MKFFVSRFSAFYSDRQVRRNAHLMFRYLAVVILVVVIYTQLFLFLMMHLEGRSFSWLTGLYWTLMVMSTLGFGDITFTTDIGRLFTIVVLLSGILLLLVVLPFVFIRLAPWLEARFRMRAPARVPKGTSGHVIICTHDAIAPGLTRRLKQEAIPYFIIEPDTTRASELYVNGLAVVRGEVDRKETYENLNVARARLVLANLSDAVNTNITLTVHEVAPDVPVITISRDEHAEDVLALSGATHVLPLKRQLGEQLANRVSASHAQLHPVGRFENLLLAELPILHTPLSGKSIRGTRLREHAGISIIGVWERGRLYPAFPDHPLTDESVVVVIGTESQIDDFNDLFVIYDLNPNPVVVIGGGNVGGAAIRALHRKGLPVHLVERDRDLCARFSDQCEAIFHGDASDYELLRSAGILEAPSVLLSTNDDAMNIFLASYCRHLNPEVRIVSRVTRNRNIEALYRAGANFVLSSHSLGIDAVFSIIKDRKLIVLGERVDLFTVPLPKSLSDKTLAQSGIGAQTGLSVIAVRENGTVNTRLSPTDVLHSGMELVMMGDLEQRRRFAETFG